MTCDSPTYLNISGGIGWAQLLFALVFFFALRVGRNKLGLYFLPLAAVGCPGLGRLAPYLERPWRLLETPSLSSVPLTTW